MILFHPVCGNSFEISIVAYKTSPQCRACEKQFITTVEDPTYVYSLRARAIVGDEYMVLSYANKKIKLRHNSCGLEFEEYTYNFFKGHRCPQCTVLPPYEELNRVLTAASSGKYILTDRNPRDFQSVIVLNTESGEKKKISSWFLLQELSRPTPSARLPGTKTGYRFPNWEEYLQAYKEYREEYGKHPPKGTMYKGLLLGKWSFTMRRSRTWDKLTEDRIQTMSKAGFVWGPKFDPPESSSSDK